ncbi:MAG: hypothetical protein U1E31_00975 [Rickettsiales bacterium]
MHNRTNIYEIQKISNNLNNDMNELKNKLNTLNKEKFIGKIPKDKILTNDFVDIQTNMNNYNSTLIQNIKELITTAKNTNKLKESFKMKEILKKVNKAITSNLKLPRFKLI